MKKMKIMIGVPGSGKSTKAKQLANDFEEPHNVVICSTDDYFMVDGKYVFDHTKLGINHGRCLEKARLACREGLPVIIDNTNILKAHREPYKSIAREFGYEVEEIFVDCELDVAFARNTHGVPKATIERMIKTMER